MKNLKTKILVGVISAVIATLSGIAFNNFMNEGNTYDVGWKSWDITADVLDNGDMEVHEKLVYFDNNYDNHHVSESLISFSKSQKSNIDENDKSKLKENSFYVSVYDEEKTYFINQNEPSTNAYDTYKNDDCLGFSWVNGCLDERGKKITASGKNEKVFIYLEDGLKNGLTIEFKYIIENVITKYNDYSVLNWKFHGAYEYADNKNCNLTINLPSGGEVLNDNISIEGFSKDNMTVMGFGTTNAKLVSKSGSKIEAKAKRLYDDFNDEIEMFVSIPNSKVDLFPNIKEGDTNYSSLEGYTKLNTIIEDALKDEDTFYKSYKLLEAGIIIVCFILILINILVIRNSYIKYDKELKSDFEYEYLREIPNGNYSPSVASYLVNEQKLDVNSLNSEIMDLIRRGYINVDINGQDLTSIKVNFILVLNKEKVDEGGLNSSERFLLKWYFDDIAKGDRLSFDQLDEYMKNHVNAEKYNSNNSKWNEMVKNTSINMKWFDNVSGAKKYMGLSSIFLFVSLIVFLIITSKNLTWVSILFNSLVLGSSITILSYVPTIKRKTQLGINEYTRWMAFKKFLEEFSTFEDYPVPSLIVWEHYMVYATMFGIADLVEKQLRTRFSDLHRENEYYGNLYFRYRIHYHIHYRMNNARSIGMQAIATEKARQGGSGGRSGGFGGGSSFGGGGRGGSFR